MFVIEIYGLEEFERNEKVFDFQLMNSHRTVNYVKITSNEATKLDYNGNKLIWDGKRLIVEIKKNENLLRLENRRVRKFD